MFSRSIRATAIEHRRHLPGDDLIAHPLGRLTHAVTIHCPRLDVWPWLIQMGAGSRAGWYSYDYLDNGGKASADRIMPELQQIAPGTLFPALPGRTDGFHVLQCVPGESLVLGWLPAPDAEPMVTWAFVLDDIGGGSTRLVVRSRGGGAYRFHGMPPWLTMPVVSMVDFIMERKQLLTVATRAEDRWRRAHGGAKEAA